MSDPLKKIEAHYKMARGHMEDASILTMSLGVPAMVEGAIDDVLEAMENLEAEIRDAPEAP